MNRKILFLLHLPPPVHGSSIVGKTIMKSAKINSSFQCDYINLLMSRTIKSTGKSSIVKLFRFVSIWLELIKSLLVRKPDLCYYALSTTGMAFIKDSILIFWIKLFKIKIIFHLHNKGVSKKQDKWIYDILYKFVFKNNSVILLSQYLYSDIERYVNYENTYICPNGVSKISIYENESEGSDNDVARILFLSNLIKTKGVYELIDACEILNNKGIDFNCHFVGGEGDINREIFEKYVNIKSLSNKIKYLGKKFGDEKSNIYHNSDLFVFPTFYPNECFPLVLIEAMQHKLPVISTFEGGIMDIINDGENGYIITQKDTEMLANRMEYLIMNPLVRKNMANNALNKYENNYTLEVFENNFLIILNKVLKET